MTIEFRVDPHGPTTAFAHYWEQCVGSCHAIMGLRHDWRTQLEKVHRELGFQYVRFHGLLSEEMSVCKKNADGSLRYSFYTIDAIFDFLLQIGMKPFIELGFMPDALASGTATCFHYKANVTPPTDYAQWSALIDRLTRHLVERYGLEEVRTWFFEVWNEPNLRYFWAGTQEEYFKLYESAARAIKNIDPALRVGGPATSVNSWIPEMIAFCQDNQVPLDFVSTHHYPTDDPLWRNSSLTEAEFFAQFSEGRLTYERGVLRKMTAKAKAQAGSLPLYYTEWNTSAMIPDAQHDEPYAAALVAKTLADNDGLVEGYSFWTFSDLFEEGGQHSAPFHGGFGLQTIYGIAKPTYRIFELYHHLGQARLSVDGPSDSTVEVLAVRNGSQLTLLAWNHNIPGAPIQEEEVLVELTGLPASAQAQITRVDDDHANPIRTWQAMGSPEYPSKEQLAIIEQASCLQSTPHTLESTRTGAACRFKLPAHGVATLTISI